MNNYSTKISKIREYMFQKLDHETFPRWNRALLFLVVLFYVLSLPFDAIVVTEDWSSEVEYWAGFQVLLFGPLGILVSQLGWFANPLLVISWFRLKHAKNLSAFITVVLAMIFSVDGIFFLNQKIAHFETGSCCMHFEFSIGAYFWYFAILLQLICATISLVRLGRGVDSEDEFAMFDKGPRDMGW